MNDITSVEDVARAFVDARRSGRGLSDYPGALPQSLDEAYAIQARALSLAGGDVAGWKVGRIPDALVKTFGSNRLAGPILAGTISEAAGGDAPEMPIFAEGFGAAEAEYLLRIGSLPDNFDADWTNEAVADFVDQVRIGIEVASSPFPGINANGPAVTVSDFGNNNGLVIGPAIGMNSGFVGWPVSLAIDGVVAGTATAAEMLDGPLGALRFLFELAAQHALPLAVGQWISTGAVTGVHEVRPGAEVLATFGEGLQVRCKITG